MNAFVHIHRNSKSSTWQLVPNQSPLATTPVAGLPPMVLHFTVKEFLTAHRIGRTKFYELVKQGIIRPIKVGRKTLIPRMEMLAWVARLARPSLHRAR